jgi:hypothetical protein
MTPSGIEPVTFQFVAQYLNHCATAVPILYPVEYQNTNYFSASECVLSFEITAEDSSDKLVYI